MVVRLQKNTPSRNTRRSIVAEDQRHREGTCGFRRARRAGATLPGPKRPVHCGLFGPRPRHLVAKDAPYRQGAAGAASFRCCSCRCNSHQMITMIYQDTRLLLHNKETIHKCNYKHPINAKIIIYWKALLECNALTLSAILALASALRLLVRYIFALVR